MTHPYRALPGKAFWRRAVVQQPLDQVDPVGEFTLRLQPATKVATAGSCFAQHIARHLQASGYCYHVTEPGHPLLQESVRQAHHYGMFSARYGNLYTSRQLLQLFQRAYGRFAPEEDAWLEEDGRVLDPFRPTTQPGGFGSLAEMRADRTQHFQAVRRMFETLDVFVFTLGLTECWMSRIDGAVFPLCPGVEGGSFDPKVHEFVNLTVVDAINDLNSFRSMLQAVNPQAQIVLTVSPVPLMATAQPGQHVLAATTYSKSVLRVAAETVHLAHENVHYFPSYEIITGAYNRGRYFADDLRNVTEEGVSHVMRLFLRHATDIAVTTEAEKSLTPPRPVTQSPPQDVLSVAQHVVDVECDEVALDRPEAGATAG